MSLAVEWAELLTRRPAFQAALAPLGPVDAQRLLEVTGCDRRLAVLRELLEDEVDVLARRAGGG